MVNDPQGLMENYRRLWEKQQGQEREFYDFIRDEFNRTQRPDDLLYLLARCVKASVRYNSKGEFNQSPDNRRLGRLQTVGDLAKDVCNLRTDQQQNRDDHDRDKNED